jgi:hypothetical protein
MSNLKKESLIKTTLYELTRIFQICSILDMLTRAVSTSLEIAKVFIFANTSPSFGYALIYCG